MLQSRSVFLLYDLRLCIPAGTGSSSFFIAPEKSPFPQDPAHVFFDVAAWDTYSDSGIHVSRRSGNLWDHQPADPSISGCGIRTDAGQHGDETILPGIETLYQWSHYEYFLSNKGCLFRC